MVPSFGKAAEETVGPSFWAVFSWLTAIRSEVSGRECCMADSADEAAALLRAGADYVTVSPVFVTASKPGYGPAIGLDGLTHIVSQTPGPVIALGGITPENAALCLSTGVRGVAVMGEVMRSADPGATVESILRAMTDLSMSQ